MSSVTEPQLTEIDPLDPTLVRDPHAVFRTLREACPVARGGRWGGFWAALGYDEVVAASTAHRTFSSAEGIVVPANPVSGRRAPMHYDPPEHIRYRRALNPPFHADVVLPLEPEIRGIAAGLVDPFAAKGGGDLVAEVSSPFATRVLTRFLHLPADDADRIQQLTEEFEQAQMREDVAAAERTSTQLYDVARHAVAARRADPLPAHQDVISALFAVGEDEDGDGETGGGRLDDEFVAGSVRQLLVAGHVPVSLSIASAVRHLAGQPELQEQLRRQPELVPAAIEELLRLYTPNIGFSRTATQETELAGRRIRPGERVALVYTSANRDPSRFPEPDTLLLDRAPNRHLAFGHGVHKCVGRVLARLELRVALETLLAAGVLTPDGEPTWSHWPEYGPAGLPVRVTPLAGPPATSPATGAARPRPLPHS